MPTGSHSWLKGGRGLEGSSGVRVWGWRNGWKYQGPEIAEEISPTMKTLRALLCKSRGDGRNENEEE